MSYKISGTVIKIGDVQAFGSKGFKKRDLVIQTEAEKYQQTIAFELQCDRTELAETLAEGDHVELTFDIRGREYNGRYFNSLVVFRLECEDNNAIPDNPKPIPKAVQDAADILGGTVEQDDDIPF